MIDLNYLLELAGKHAHHTLIERQARQLMPTFLFVDEWSNATVVGCPWENPIQKQLMVAGVREKMREAGARQYSFITEAWFAPAPKNMSAADLERSGLRASQMPDRDECVIALATDGVATKWRRWQIKRDWKGKIRELTEMPTGEKDEFASPFANLLGGVA